MILPKNELKEIVKTPKMFLIWGQSMSGKTYLSRQFPNPIMLNTDGNASKIPEPSIEIHSFEQFMEAIEEIEKGNHTFQTVVIDLIDDIATMMEDFICRKNSNEKVTYTALAEIPYGKGFSERKAIWKALMMRLSQLSYNVIGISHFIERTENDITIQQPSLEQVYLNMFKGRCDAYIKCSKIGNAYIQKCEEKRDNYVLADVKDPKLNKALENVRGLFADGNNNTPTMKPAGMKKVEAAKEEVKEEKVEETTETPVEETKPEIVEVNKPTLKPTLKKKEN